MMHFKTEEPWLDELMPEGIPVPASILISGPGGSGKPLVGYSVVAPWLRKGGSVIFLLTSTGKDFADEVLKKIYNLDITAYSKQLSFIDFNPDLPPNVEGISQSSADTITANLVNPAVFDEALKQAGSRFQDEKGPGTLVFGSALNLFLFSRTYGESILKHLQELIRDDKSRTYLFTVSTSAYKEKIRLLEEVADHLMFTRNEEPMKLFLNITRISSAPFSGEEIVVPLSESDLNTIKSLAEKARGNLLPRISKI